VGRGFASDLVELVEGIYVPAGMPPSAVSFTNC